MEKSNIYEQLANLSRFRERLVDDQSKDFLDSYVMSFVYRDQSFLLDEIFKMVCDSKKLQPKSDFAEFMAGRDQNKIIVFGAGKDGKATKVLLEKMGMSTAFFCDNNAKLWGKAIDGIEVIAPQKLLYQYRDYVVIIGSSKYGDILFKQLLRYRYPQKNIYYPPCGILQGNIGWQYFDLPYFNKDEQEVFIDCGCCDFGSSYGFAKWCNGQYKQIYAFEPDKMNFALCQERTRDMCSVQLIPKGAYSETAVLRFHESGAASSICDDGNVEVEVTSIDEVLDGARATFIKMDIEGSELQALQGAKKTIQAHYPKLAICMYHKITDLIEIPEYLMRIAPKYKYAIRVYTSSFSETVLYAWKE